MSLETSSEALLPSPNMQDRSALFEKLSGFQIRPIVGDLRSYEVMNSAFEQANPDAVIHYAEQPSAPYSMMGRDQARLTLQNNLDVTFNCIWAAIERNPGCHIITLATMGEYGTPNIDIEEGWIEISHRGRADRFLYPRAAGSLYHTTKILDTDLLWFYVRTYALQVTDLMQGPVYGLVTAESQASDQLLPNFHYDDIFGTVLNRFLVQAVVGAPLTVYGKGHQQRGYLNLVDTLRCVELAALTPPTAGELRIMNQFTEVFSVLALGEKVREAAADIGLEVKLEKIPNPRKEKEEHYYNPAHTGLTELGLKPTLLTQDRLVEMLRVVLRYSDRVDRRKIMPRVSWR